MTSDDTSPRLLAARASPFRGLRYADAATIGDRTFVPPQSWSEYADLDESELDAHHVLRLLEPVFGGTGAPANAGEVAEQLDAWISQGTLVHDDAPSMYVYRRKSADGRALVGVIAAVALTEQEGPTMLGHEQVLEPLVDIQGILERATSAQFEPIVTVCSGTGAPGSRTLADVVAPVLGRPASYRVDENRAESAQVVHQLWVVTDPELHREVDAIAGAAPLLIADGHHRFAAWSAEGPRDSGPADLASDPWGFALTMLVDSTDDGLSLGPVHRVVTGIDLAAAARTASVDTQELADVHEAERYLADGPDGRCVFATKDDPIRGTKESYLAITPGRATPAPACTSPECAVCWLHDVWLPAWGVEDDAVEYVHDLSSAMQLAAGPDRIAVLLPAPGLDSVLDAAQRGAPLPHKATSFGPKPRVGMVMRRWGAI